MPFDGSTYYLRSLEATAISTGGRFLLTRPGDGCHVFDDIDVERVSRIWEDLSSPLSGDQLAALLGAEAAVIALVGQLVERGFIDRGTAEQLRRRRAEAERPVGRKPCRHLLLGVSGGVQAATILNYIGKLLAAFAEQLDVILTESAQRFVRPEALAVLGVGVWCDPWKARGEVTVPHVHLAKLAELVLILPASAHTISRLANATCSDLLSLAVCATRAPVIVVPSMNPAMWRNPAVRRNVTQLRRDGVFVVEPALGFEVAERQTSTVDVGAAGLDPFNPSMPAILEAVLRQGARRVAGQAPG